ncbi:ribonuclease P protein component 1 [Halorientalis regularis]|jgi:ribonuclease P protein subunit POP4|uniref:Ribonuclease P protein component 1 n=1 Tax=Halorientalis regularis TaxID=660518 RepID=A0A1G7I3U1_9EURY|nr:ribonuclease P protein component 1 [Halorientalis regularis]SDF07457.1 ribonuclease P protein subunit Rpp29 [Halorientalis regularis]
MPLTPATLTRHELIGRPVRVVAASNPHLVGIAGEVVMETTRTLSVEGSNGEQRVWQVPKADATFEFDLPGGETVTVEGEQLVARPARRTERTGDSKWR